MIAYKVFVRNTKTLKLESVYADGEFKITTSPFRGERVIPNTRLLKLGQGVLSFASLEEAILLRLDAEFNIGVDLLQVWECKYEAEDILSIPVYYMGSLSYNATIDRFVEEYCNLLKSGYPTNTVCTKQLTLVKRLV